MKCPFAIKVCTKCKKILVANEINFRKKKDGRHEDVFSNVREIDLVLDLSRERKSYGNVFLYDEIDFQHLLELCKNYKI